MQYPRLALKTRTKAEQLDPNELVTIEELANSSMWKVAALVEVLERKGIPNCLIYTLGGGRGAIVTIALHPATRYVP